MQLDVRKNETNATDKDTDQVVRNRPINISADQVQRGEHYPNPNHDPEIKLEARRQY